jgi:microcystin-dependent protein
MANPYIGEIRIFAGSFAPVGWAACNGQLLQINVTENEALFQIIGTTYGGDGQNDFALPDLRGRLPVGRGAGPNLSARTIGDFGGVETVTITTSQLPGHAHTMTKGTLAIAASSAAANRRNPSQAVSAREAAGVTMVYSGATADTTMAAGAIVSGTPALQGGGQPTGVVQPVLTVMYIIALVGIFPSQT